MTPHAQSRGLGWEGMTPKVTEQATGLAERSVSPLYLTTLCQWLSRTAKPQSPGSLSHAPYPEIPSQIPSTAPQERWVRAHSLQQLFWSGLLREPRPQGSLILEMLKKRTLLVFTFL